MQENHPVSIPLVMDRNGSSLSGHVPTVQLWKIVAGYMGVSVSLVLFHKYNVRYPGDTPWFAIQGRH